MTRITVAPNELAIKALRCPDDRPHMVVHLEGHGNAGLKLYVERSGTKSWYYRARVMGSGSREMPLGRCPDVSIAAARQRKADAVAAISGGQDPWRERRESQRRRHGITLDVVFDGGDFTLIKLDLVFGPSHTWCLVDDTAELRGLLPHPFFGRLPSFPYGVAG